MKKQRRVRKKLEDLTIVDDFMFGAVMSDPKRCKPLLEFILGIKIDRIEYPELQKTIDKQYNSKSVRLDVYVADDKGTVYNVEIQTTRKKYLPKRMRYYGDVIDLNIIDKGEDYSGLKNSYVIFICTFDPFGQDRYVYTFENCCLEDTEIRLNDGTTKIVLNTEGTVGNISENLKDTLRFMAGDAPKGEYTKGLAKAVEEIKESKEWRRDYMNLALSYIEQKKLGKYAAQVSFVRNSGNEVTSDFLSKQMGVETDVVRKIKNLIIENPDWDDEDIADELLEDE